MPSANRPLVPPRLVLGMVTFVLGALFLADSADLLRADSALAFWPVALLALGLVVVLQPDPANRIVGALLLIAGVWLLLNAVGIWRYRFWQTWPYLLIVFGAWMIYRVYQLREKARRDGWVTGFAFLNSVATPGRAGRSRRNQCGGGRVRDRSAQRADGREPADRGRVRAVRSHHRAGAVRLARRDAGAAVTRPRDRHAADTRRSRTHHRGAGFGDL
jgi:hypothetical protein